MGHKAMQEMGFEAKRNFLVGFLLLPTLFLASNFFLTDAKTEKIYARNVDELSRAITAEQRKGRPLRLPELITRVSQPPPPAPKSPSGPIPELFEAVTAEQRKNQPLRLPELITSIVPQPTSPPPNTPPGSSPKLALRLLHLLDIS